MKQAWLPGEEEKFFKNLVPMSLLPPNVEEFRQNRGYMKI